MISTSEALVSTGLALAAGVVLAYLCKTRLKVEGGAPMVAVLFAPTLLFLGLSGRLVEFKGLGIEAKFQQVAAKAVVPSNINPVAPSASAIQSSSGAKAMMGMGSDVVVLPAPAADQPVTHQQVLDVALQIAPGLLQGNFQLMVVIDPSGRVLGYFRREFFLDLLRIELEQTIRGSRTNYDSARVRSQLEQTQLWDIVEYPAKRADAWGSKMYIQLSDSNASALKKLAQANQDAAVVVTAGGAYAGIVRRSDIVAELLGALSAPLDAPATR